MFFKNKIIICTHTVSNIIFPAIESQQPSPNNCEYERGIRRLRRQADWAWLNACLGVLDGDANPVEAYLSSGGDPARQLTASEVSLLNRYLPSLFNYLFKDLNLKIII